jgi:hypothetical protein
MIISGGIIFSISQRSEYPVEAKQPLEKIISGNIPGQADVPRPAATLAVVISTEVINDFFDAVDAKAALEEGKLHGFKDWEDVKRDLGL